MSAVAPLAVLLACVAHAKSVVRDAAGAWEPALAMQDAAPLADADVHARDLARWRELLDLDLGAVVLAEAEPLVAPGAPRERDGETVALVARAVFAAGDEVRAERLAARDADTDAGRDALEVTRARFAIERDELAKAYELLRQRANDASVAEASLLLGRVLFRSGRTTEARAPLERFVALAPHDYEVPSAYFMLAQVSLGLRELERAARERERAEKSSQWHAYFKARKLQMREHPLDPLPRFGVAELWIAANELDRARSELGELTALFPKFARGWSLLGDVQRARKGPEQAALAYAKALELEPALPDALLGRARCAIDLAKWAEARKDLDALVLGPHGSDARLAPAHLELARVLAKLGDADAAAKRHARYRELGGTEPLEKR